MSGDWTYLLADLRTNAILAEVELSEVRLGKRLNDAGDASGTLSVGGLGFDAYQATRPARTALYALRDGVPWWGGIIWTARYSSSTGAVALGAGDWLGYFDHRRVVAPIATTFGLTDVATQRLPITADTADVVRLLLDAAQAHTAGNIGLVPQMTTTGTTVTAAWPGYTMATVGEEIRRIAAMTGGPDIAADVAGVDEAGRPRRILRIGSPMLGQQGSAHVFEDGGNLTSWDLSSDGTRMATRRWALGPGSEVATVIAVAEDVRRYATGWPLLEEDATYTGDDVGPTDVLAHAAGDLAATALPVVAMTATIDTAYSPSLGEIGVGDDARVVVPPGDQWFSGGLDTRLRIIGISVTPGSADTSEATTLTMAPTLEDMA